MKNQNSESLNWTPKKYWQAVGPHLMANLGLFVTQVRVVQIFEIAGIRFRVNPNVSNIVHEPDTAYRAFLTTTKHQNTVFDAAIEILFNGVPGVEKPLKLIGEGKGWFMSWDGTDHYLAVNSPDFNQANLTAHIQDDFTKISVYCSEKLRTYEHDKDLFFKFLHYPLDRILFMYLLAQREGALLHTATLNFNGKGYLFAGKSGAGKSTLSRQFLVRNFGQLLSDDRIAIRKMDKTFTLFGTPWTGASGIAVNASVPLAGIFFITHGKENHIRELRSQEALEKLLPVTSIPWYDREIVLKILSFAEDLLSRIPSYELAFKPDIEVVDVLEQFLSTELG